jgi:MraZ protein
MFSGSSLLALDNRGRMTVPARYRQALADDAGGRLVITKHPIGCLMLMTPSRWDAFYAVLRALPMSADHWRRVFIGNADTLVEIDNAGRVLISPELRDEAGLALEGENREVRLMGVGEHFEIWNAARYRERERSMEGAALPEAIASFVI